MHQPPCQPSQIATGTAKVHATDAGTDACITVHLRIEGPGLVCTAALVTDAISGALQQLFGYIGGAVLFDVVDADAGSGRAKVLLDQRDVQKVQAAAACFTALGGAPASLRYQLHQEQPHQQAPSADAAVSGGTEAKKRNSRFDDSGSSTRRQPPLRGGLGAMSNGGGVGVGTSRSPVMDAAVVPPRSPRLQPDAVDIERQPILETTQLEVPARGRMLKSSSVIFGGGPINFTFPTWIMTLTIIISWYASNTGLLILNKWLLSTYGFRKPVFLTLCHMLACSAMGAGASAARIVPPQPIKSPEQFRKIAGLAVVFCLSVVLGNVALRFIPVSFSQAIGATTPVFTAVLAVAMMGKRETGIVYAALLPVVIGIVIATGAEPLFDMAGFSAAVIATAMRALKSVLQGMLLMDASEKMDSLNLLRWMAPIASLCLIPAVLVLEPTVIREAMEMGVQQPNFLWLLAFNAFLAYFTNLTNFLVTRYTSALTLQVLGNAKGVFTTALSIFIFRNPFTVTSVGGYLITVAGVGCYAAAKRYQTAQKTSLTSTRD